MISVFCMGLVMKGKQHLRLPFLVGCGQVYVARLQDSLILNISGSHQGKVASETTNSSWVDLIVSLIESDRRIL